MCQNPMCRVEEILENLFMALCLDKGGCQRQSLSLARWTKGWRTKG